ncbi:MAG: DASH family cryptochrome [Bacteroidia bacterium]
MHKNVLLWFRNNLRINDNIALTQAAKNGKVLAVFVLNQNLFEPKLFGLQSIGQYRYYFLFQSLQNLKQNLKKIGVTLLVKKGLPEVEIGFIIEKYNIHEIHFTQEPGYYEQLEEQSVLKLCNSKSVKAVLHKPDLLCNFDELPFAVTQTPELFTSFRKKVEKFNAFGNLASIPQKIEGIEVAEDEVFLQNVPKKPEIPKYAAFKKNGGEDAAIAHLQEYIWDKQQYIKTYKETRNGLIGNEYSSKLSPWLANGSISVRQIFAEVKRFENEVIANQSTYWLIFELLWRDYFKLIMLKHGNKLFKTGGIQNHKIKWTEDEELFFIWAYGKTGYPLVDANMNELRQTGFMSNRGRQIVASFLTKNLGINWQWGAFWFEHHLVDYDVSSNYGNWNYAAGIGNDARGFRYFNIYKQALQYDPNGDYIRLWIPELAQVEGFKAHQPKNYGINYYSPIVDLEESAAKNENLYNKAISFKK